MTIGLIAVLVFGIGLVAALAKGLFIVQQSQTVVVERLGSYSRTLKPGINFIVPFIDQPRAIKIRRYESAGLGSKELEPRIIEETKLDTRETVLNFPAQPVFTKDNGSVRIDGALYFQIEEPVKAVYAVENLVLAVETLTKTTLRSVVGEMDLDQLFSSRDEINLKLAAVMDEAGNKWGVKINRVELQDISVPENVEESMLKQIAAERSRRAAVAEANGNREAEILRAEGEKAAAILRAQGERQAIEEVLSAGTEDDKISTSAVISYLIAQRYIDMLPDIAKKGERILVPYEATALLGSLHSIKDLFPAQGAGNGSPAAGLASVLAGGAPIAAANKAAQGG